MRLHVDDAPHADAGAPTTAGGHRSERRADIQGLRGLAVLLVVVFHAGLPLPGGFVGVDMFFVVSGFVITGMLARQLDRSSKLSFGSFYTRRVRRLLPALALVITFVAVASAFLLSPYGPQQATARTGIAASLFTANFQLGGAHHPGYFDLAAETNAFLHTWSLSVEEQFYLVFPALLVVAWRLARRFPLRRSPRRALGAIVLVATGVSFDWSYFMTFHPSSALGSSFAFYSASTRAWEFGVGVLLALATPTLRRVSQPLVGVLGGAGVALIAFAAITLTGTTPYPGVAALLPVIGTALLLIVGMGASRGITTGLSIRPAVWLGDVSYGWYLWHWPFIVFAAALWPGRTWVLVVAAVVSLIPTWLSYRLVERPIRFNDRLVGRRVVPLILVCIGVPVVACFGLLRVNRSELRTDAVKALGAATQLHRAGPADCDNSTLAPAADCPGAVALPSQEIALVGDSNAGQFAEPVAQAASDLGLGINLATKTGCPFADVIRESSLAANFDGAACHQWVTDSVALMQASHPALVIIATSSAEVVNDSASLQDPRSGEVATTPEAKAKVWEDGLASVLSQLEQAGIPTLVIHPVPHLGEAAQDWQAASCPAVRIYAHACGASIDRSQVERQQQLAREAEDRAVARVPGASSADFTTDVCSPQACTAYRDGIWMYRDASHLSVDGALTLTDRFRQLIGQLRG